MVASVTRVGSGTPFIKLSPGEGDVSNDGWYSFGEISGQGGQLRVLNFLNNHNRICIGGSVTIDLNYTAFIVINIRSEQ